MSHPFHPAKRESSSLQFSSRTALRDFVQSTPLQAPPPSQSSCGLSFGYTQRAAAWSEFVQGFPVR